MFVHNSRTEHSLDRGDKVRMQSPLNRSKHSYNLQGNAMCFSSNVQCKLLSSIHAAKYRVIAHNLGYIAVLHNCIYVS